MGRKEIKNELEKIVGGTIMFNEDNTKCGYFCDDQYEVYDFDACLDYLLENKGKMSERNLLKKCVELGYIGEL